MKLQVKNPFVLMLLSLMTGVFVTISFLETPMKFQVPGMTLSVALELGKVMFGISAKIQYAFLILIFLVMIFRGGSFSKSDYIVITVLLAVLTIEKFWMLPVLDARADLLSAGKTVPPSDLHNYFIYMETAKLILLLFAIVLQFKIKRNEY